MIPDLDRPDLLAGNACKQIGSFLVSSGQELPVLNVFFQVLSNYMIFIVCFHGTFSDICQKLKTTTLTVGFVGHVLKQFNLN